MIIKEIDEISTSEALKRNYLRGRVPFLDYQRNRTEYKYVTSSFSIIFISVSFRECWLCNSVNENSTATFDYRHPPIIIVTIKAPATRNEEGYGEKVVRLRDLNTFIRISSIE
jgi:hypothetical protein